MLQPPQQSRCRPPCTFLRVLEPTAITIAIVLGWQRYPGSDSDSNFGPAPQFGPINQSMRRPSSKLNPTSYFKLTRCCPTAAPLAPLCALCAADSDRQRQLQIATPVVLPNENTTPTASIHNGQIMQKYIKK
ncbi:hypothetical protein ACLKA6_003536 [Drosophila palustris]